MSNNTIFDGVDLGCHIDNNTLDELRRDYVKYRKEYYQDAARAGLTKGVAMQLRKLATWKHNLDLAACNCELTEDEARDQRHIPVSVQNNLSNYPIEDLEFNSDSRSAPFRFRLNGVTVVPAYFPV
jgi:hypothetical protein